MSMNKRVNIPLETTAYYQSTSNLNIQFWNQDLGVAELQFLITRNNFPLPLSNENVQIVLALESGESFITTDDIDIINEVEGVASYIIPPEFMAVANEVTGQVYVATLDGDEIVVQRKFTFTVENDLLSSIPSEEKIRYIKMFSDLQEEMSTRLGGVETALSQLESNVDAVNNARQNGIAAINNLYDAKLVTFNQNYDDKMALINSAMGDMETYVDTSLADMTQKKADFDASVNGSGLVTTGQSANWQKYKLTQDDGGSKIVNLGDDLATMRALEPGNYYVSSTPITGASSTLGFLNMEARGTPSDATVKRITYRPYNSNTTYVMRYYNVDGWYGWENALASMETITGSQNKANTAENNAKIYSDTKLAATRKTLFSGSVNGVGSTINLTDSINNYGILIVSGSYPGGTFTETILVNTLGSGCPIQKVNLSDSSGGGLTVYEMRLGKVNSTTFSIELDNRYDAVSDTPILNSNTFTIQRIEAIK